MNLWISHSEQGLCKSVALLSLRLYRDLRNTWEIICCYRSAMANVAQVSPGSTQSSHGILTLKRHSAAWKSTTSRLHIDGSGSANEWLRMLSLSIQ